MLAPLSLLALSLASAESWPDLSRPADSVGGGETDVGVVVGIENYGFVPPVPGAESNAKAWHSYLTRTRGASPANVRLLLGVDATRDDILDAAQAAAKKAGSGARLWFVFIGHGAPSANGKDGLLVGVDAQQKAESLQKRSVRREELLSALAKSRAESIAVVLDACFSGRGPDGATIAPGLQPLVTVAAPGAADPRVVVLTAAKGDQFAGALPGASRPAFSYLALGALRGWAGAGPVTAAGIHRYATSALEATLRGRNQTPDLLGREDAVLAKPAGEKGPDLAALAQATAGGGGTQFSVTNLPSVPKAQAPKALDAAGSGIDFGSVDVEALEKYDAAVELDKGKAAAEQKAQSWRKLAASTPKFTELAEKRAADWDRYAAQERAAIVVREQRARARDADWEKLARLLALKVVADKDKQRWAGKFVEAYLDSPGLDWEMATGLIRHMQAGPAHARLARLAREMPNWMKAGIEWVRLPGGSFEMGSKDVAAFPVHSVTVNAFYMAKTETTVGQYKACLAAKACTGPAPTNSDEYPVPAVSWHHAKEFADWAGARLPSEAEWEYAARSAGQDIRYPWGNESPNCERTMWTKCGGRVEPVCSRPAGNTRQGLCDMVGGVSEWVQDWFHDNYEGAPSDGSAWEDPRTNARTVRGASWAHEHPSSLRAAFRWGYEPGFRTGNWGFRLAR